MIDTHSHIYLDNFDADRREMIERARAVGIKNIMMPNINSQTIDQMLAVETAYPNFCHAMMGLHPTSVKEDYQQELDTVRKWLDSRNFAAIGEIGMDLYWDKGFLEEQKKVFATQLEWAIEFDLPVVIHVRDAFQETFKVIESIYKPPLRGVFHSFSGTADDAEYILNMPKFYLGINGMITFKKTHLKEVLQPLGYDRIVMETDSPYLAPAPYRGKRNEPAYLELICKTLADLFAVTTQEMVDVTSSNAKKIFNSVL